MFCFFLGMITQHLLKFYDGWRAAKNVLLSLFIRFFFYLCKESPDFHY